MQATDLRPLSLGEILDRSFSLYRRYFGLFFGISAIPALLSLALNLYRVLNMTNVGHVGAKTTQIFPELTASYLVVTLLSAVVGMLVYLFAQGGTVYAVTELYLGRKTSLTGAMEYVWNHLWSLFGVMLLNGLAILGGLILLVVPGIYLTCRLLVTLPAALVEKLGPRASLSRSFHLTKNEASRAFLIILVFLAISMAAGTVIGLVLIPITLSHQDPGITRQLLAVSIVGQVLISALIAPTLYISSSLFYFDLRIRKEAFDLQFMMNPQSAHLTRAPEPGSML